MNFHEDPSGSVTFDHVDEAGGRYGQSASQLETSQASGLHPKQPPSFNTIGGGSTLKRTWTFSTLIAVKKLTPTLSSGGGKISKSDNKMNKGQKMHKRSHSVSLNLQLVGQNANESVNPSSKSQNSIFYYDCRDGQFITRCLDTLLRLFDLLEVPQHCFPPSLLVVCTYMGGWVT